MATPDAPSAFYAHWDTASADTDVSEFHTGFMVEKTSNIVEETYGDSGNVSRAAGSNDFNFGLKSAKEHDDYAIVQNWFPLIGTEALFEVRPNDAAASASNPKFTGSAFPTKVSLDVTAGGEATTAVEFAQNGEITMATS